MKKVLFASTALIATAGIAAADVAITGLAEIGIAGGDGDTVTQFFQDIDVRFALSGETDGGIAFGANVDLDEVNGGATGDTDDDFGTSIFISGAFGTLTLGDTDGGFDAGMQEVNIGSPGSIADNETEHAGYNGNSGLDGTFDGQILSYRYSVSGFTIIGSVEMDDDADDGSEGDPVFGIGASYGGSFAGGSYTVGGGYQQTNDTGDADGNLDLTAIGISATVALDMGLSAGINYSEIESDDGTTSSDETHFGIGASYSFDAFTVHANYGEFDRDVTATEQDSSGFGLALAYDFGGGLSAHLGYESSNFDDLNAVLPEDADEDFDRFSLGLSMSF